MQDLTFPDAPVYTDYHEKHISVPSLRPGDVLEYRFVRTIATPLDSRAVLDQLQLRREGNCSRRAVGDQRSQRPPDQAED